MSIIWRVNNKCGITIQFSAIKSNECPSPYIWTPLPSSSSPHAPPLLITTILPSVSELVFLFVLFLFVHLFSSFPHEWIYNKSIKGDLKLCFKKVMNCWYMQQNKWAKEDRHKRAYTVYSIYMKFQKAELIYRKSRLLTAWGQG